MKDRGGGYSRWEKEGPEFPVELKSAREKLRRKPRTKKELPVTSKRWPRREVKQRMKTNGGRGGYVLICRRREKTFWHGDPARNQPRVSHRYRKL